MFVRYRDGRAHDVAWKRGGFKEAEDLRESMIALGSGGTGGEGANSVSFVSNSSADQLGHFAEEDNVNMLIR